MTFIPPVSAQTRASALGVEASPADAVDASTYVSTHQEAIGQMDLTAIPSEMIARAMLYAKEHPEASSSEILVKLYTDDQGKVVTTGDPHTDEALQQLATYHLQTLGECGLFGGTSIGADADHPNGDLEAGLVALNQVSSLLLQQSLGMELDASTFAIGGPPTGSDGGVVVIGGPPGLAQILAIVWHDIPEDFNLDVLTAQVEAVRAQPAAPRDIDTAFGIINNGRP